MATSFPGPNHAKYLDQLGEMTCNLTTHFPVDIQASKGNFISDTDGNLMLDVYNSIGIIALGYNHPGMADAVKSDLMTTLVTNRTALGVYPPKEYVQMLNDAFMTIAPKGLNRINPMMCGTCANEGAFKTAFAVYMKKKRGERFEFTEIEQTSCLKNEAPGSPDLGILSFKCGFHGRLLGALSASRTAPITKIDMPAFDWPAADPPAYKYPFDKHLEYNLEQDEIALQGVKDLIHQWKADKGIEIAAVVMEPIIGAGGDRHVSDNFARGIRKLTKEMGISFIVDEVVTSVGVTGTFWAHEQWGLDSPPDFVTFAKKMQSSGFYMADESKFDQGYRHFNTFLGDPVRTILTSAQNKIIQNEKLVEHAKESGQYLHEQLQELSERHPQMVADVRGRGLYQAWDVPAGVDKRAELIHLMKHEGVNQGVSGVNTVRLRPSLYFSKKHTDILVSALDRAIAKIKL